MMRRRSRRDVYLDVKDIPPKINEIISYLSMDFAKNHLLDRDDLAQDLYVLYLKMIKDNPAIANQLPGYFFIKFKWSLLTKWSKRVKEINNEWKYKRNQLGDFNMKSGESRNEHGDYVPYMEAEKDPKKKKAFKKLTKKRKKYGF
jgi:hypothetical protein